VVQFRRNVIGKLLNRRIEKFNCEQKKHCADQGGVPNHAWRHQEAERHRHDKKHRFIAQRRLGRKAVT